MRTWVLGVLVGMAALVGVGCVPRTSGFEVSEYRGIAHSNDGRVWITGTTTTYATDANGRLVVTGAANWIKVCAEPKPAVLTCRPAAVSEVTDAPLEVAPTAPPKEQDEGDDEEEDGDEDDEDER